MHYLKLVAGAAPEDSRVRVLTKQLVNSDRALRAERSAHFRTRANLDRVLDLLAETVEKLSEVEGHLAVASDIVSRNSD